VIHRVQSGIMPTSKNDASALIHDIEYLLYSNQNKPDSTSVSNAGWLSQPMKYAYKLKDLVGYKPTLNPKAYKELREIIDYSPQFQGLDQYDLKWSDGRRVRPVSDEIYIM